MKKLLLFTLLVAFSFSLKAQITPPLNMTLHAQWDADTLPTAGSREYNDIWGWVDCEQNEYAIMGSAAYVHFFDVTDVDNIVELGFFEGGQVTTWRDMKTYRDRAYAVSENTSEGLMIFDLSNIQDTIIKSYHSNEFFNRAHNIFIDNDHGRLYAVGTDTENNGVIIFDIATDPDNPTILASVELPGGGYVHDIFVRDNIGYCSHGYDGFYIWDFNDPENPVYMSDIATSGYNHSSWVTDDGNTVIYAEEVPLGLPMGVLDISDIGNGNINTVTTFKFPLLAPAHENNVPHNPFIRGNYVITSYYHDGVQIFDISDPANPTQVAHYDTHSNSSYSGYSGCWGVYPFLPSGTIIASDINEGLHVLTADLIDFDAVETTQYPDVTITDNTPTPFCSGENGVLELPEGAENYTWYQDGNIVSMEGNTYSPTTSGEFYGIANNSHCAATSETISLEVSPSPDLSGFSTEPVSYCEGEILSLFGPVGQDHYTWFENGNIVQDGGMVFNIPGPGSYSLMIELGPCSATSEEIIVTVDSNPDVTLELIGDAIEQGPTSAVFCAGDLITLQVPQTTDAIYSWTDDNQEVLSTSNTLEITENGNYTVEVTGPNGCTSISQIFTIAIVTIDDMIAFENGVLSATANANSYQWFLNGEAIDNATSMDFTPTESGDYYCEIENVIGCTATTNTVNVTISSNNKIENIDFLSIFPNPTNGQVLINLEVAESMELIFKIIHVDGRLMKSFSKSVQGQINIPLDFTDFSAGVYMIQIENKKGIMTRKVVKL